MTGHTPWESSLGGSESALVFMARALADRGHDVDVYTRCTSPGQYDGVDYHDVATLKTDALARDWDVFVALRFAGALHGELRAGLKILWCQDVLSGPGARPMLDNWVQHLDRFLFVSEWHRADTVKVFPEIADISWATRNPIWAPSIPAGLPAVDRPPLVVHLSRPERGLQPLLDIWPRVRARLPEAELRVARYRSFHEPRGGTVEAFSLTMDERVRETAGASHIGNLDKNALYQLLGSAALMAYPANFDETSCIAAIEAQACGTPIVAAPRGALPETIAAGAASFLPIGGPEAMDAFADEIVALLRDPVRREAMAAAGRANAARFSAAVLAEEWETQWLEFFANRSERRAGAVTATLAADGDGTAVADLVPAPTVLWPGLGPSLLERIRRQVGAPRTLGVVAPAGAEADVQRLGSLAARFQQVHPAALEGLLPVDAVVDLGGLLTVPDRAAWLRRLSSGLPPGTPVVHVLPSGHRADGSPGASARLVDPSYADIAAWFPGAAGHDLTVEVSSPFGRPLRCWVVSYRAGEIDFGEDAPAVKRSRTRPHPRISVCMIVRNEERHILRSLHATLPIAAEYRIVDTGSRDRTVDLVEGFARTCGVPVHLTHAVWPDDFSAARNLSIRDAQGDWILWIDADEELVGAEHMRRATESEWHEAFAIRQHNLIFDRGVTQIEQPLRLFRNGRGYRFYGCIHEHPERALNVSIEQWVPLAGSDILHTGYLTESGRMHKCLRRNLALLQRDMVVNPGRLLTRILYLRDCINLAHVDLRAGGAMSEESRAALLGAVEDFERTFLQDRDRWYLLGREYYDRGLELLGVGRGVTVRIEGTGMDLLAKTHHFRDPSDFLRVMMEAGQETLHRMGYRQVPAGEEK